MKQIASFEVNHDYIVPGMYVSRIDGDITTYDLRTRRPNAGDYMDNLTMHSVEHLFATYVRNSALGGQVLYFGPMGCRTGFYLLLRDVPQEAAYRLVLETLEQVVSHQGRVFGAERTACGNYQNLDTAAAVAECRAYLPALLARGMDLAYPTEAPELDASPSAT
ncbi:MAG: S-ribosylhomocysteine lyase [Eubacteriales bacterium]